MRVIAGEAKGRTLVIPRGGGTRAATDRIRETLFAILEPTLAGARVLDLFAGSGSLGIEALSRGAALATFVERDEHALVALRRNLETTGLGARTLVVGATVGGYLERGADGPFDVVFCDPPFADVPVLEATLARPELRASCAPGATVVARVLRKHPPALPPEATLARERRIGEESLLFLRYRQTAAGGG